MPTINQFSAVTSLNPSDQLLVFSSSNGDTRKASISTLLDFFGANFVSPEFIETYANPTLSGFVVPVPTSTANQWLILAPTGAFAAGTITLPLSSGLVDGQQVLVTTTQAIAAFTINPNGASVIGFPTALGAGGFFSLRYEKQGNRWFTTAVTLGTTSVFTSITLTDFVSTIKDLNGQTILALTPNYAGVVAGNFVTITNRATGGAVAIQATGIDANVGINLSAKGSAAATLGGGNASAVANQGTGALDLNGSEAVNIVGTTNISGSLNFPTLGLINAPSLVIPLITTGTLAQLQAASTSRGNPAGLRATCTNSTQAFSAANYAAAITAGGSNIVPAFFDGSTWRIG